MPDLSQDKTAGVRAAGAIWPETAKCHGRAVRRMKGLHTGPDTKLPGTLRLIAVNCLEMLDVPTVIRRRNILQNLLVDPENLIDGIITDCVDDHLHSMFCRFPYTGVQLGIRAHFDTAMSRTIGIILLQARTLGTDCAIAEKLTGPDGKMNRCRDQFPDTEQDKPFRPQGRQARVR